MTISGIINTIKRISDLTESLGNIMDGDDDRENLEDGDIDDMKMFLEEYQSVLQKHLDDIDIEI